MALVISVLVGIVAIAATRAGVQRLAAEGTARDPHVYWSVGLAGVLPAWLILFVALLGNSPGERPALGSAVTWILSAAAGLIGAIAGEARIRHLSDAPEGLTPARGWRVGLWSGIPAWVIAALGHLLPLFA